VSAEVTHHPSLVAQADRIAVTGGPGVIVWFTGLSGSGKSTVAVEVERRLIGSGRAAVVLDGDNLRLGLNADLGFSETDRVENLRRIAEIATLFAQAGLVALVPVISPARAHRDAARAIADREGVRFVEVFVDTPLEECERRDPKGLYRRARSGELTGFTGIDAPYEPPDSPDLVLRPSDGEAATQASRVLEVIA
jgi:bifunctional enzyme CysN/CysC